MGEEFYGLTKDRIKSILTNVISKNTEKAVNQANYDRTILATIQYCINSSLGQYRIKYQNGYYIAYAEENQDYTYSDGAAVYVKVPGNDFTKRLFITGSATSSSGDKVYLNNLDANQQYKTKGPSIITKGARVNTDSLAISSYDCPTTGNKEYVKVFYKAGRDSSNILGLTQDAEKCFTKYNYFKLALNFKTAFLDSRKNNGDYGIRIVLKYYKQDSATETELKTYELNTFMMSGAPFEFTDYTPQYVYFQLSGQKFIQVEEISGYVKNFPAGQPPYEKFKDVFFKDINIYPATQLYSTSNYTYEVNITSDDSQFNFTPSRSTITCTAEFYTQNGIEVNGTPGQELKYYWGKQDSTVDNVNHSRYNEALGEGWYCLNPCQVKKSSASTVQELSDESIIELSQTDQITAKSSEIEWNTSAKSIVLQKSLFRGKVSKIRCVVEYNNTRYTSTDEIIENPEGYYILVGSQGDQTIKYNGLGYFTIAAGVFQDIDGHSTPDNSLTLDSSVEYRWKEIKEGIERDLPLSSANDILLPSSWVPMQGNVHKDDEMIPLVSGHENPTVNAYLNESGHEGWRLSLERWSYYNNTLNILNNKTDEEKQAMSNPSWQDRYDACLYRMNYIIEEKQDYIYRRFDGNVENTIGYYILGPSTVTAIYEHPDGDYTSAKTKDIVPDDLSPYAGRPAIYNTLYKLPVNKIPHEATYKVSVIRTDNVGTYEIGSETITLINDTGNTLEYSLDITNGIQTYMYSEKGLSPTSSDAVQPITIQPLSFVLSNKSGEILYDSTDPESYPDIDIGELHPIWKFADAGTSLISTAYTGNAQNRARKINETTWALDNEPFFYYTLRENYNTDCKDNSNIQLEITYDDTSVFATTSFTFAKQGDLGTNGTDYVLGITSNAYDNYKSDVLSASKYCWANPYTKGTTAFSDPARSPNRQYVGPSQRHLSGPYLFATDSYSDLNTLSNAQSGKYVNLHIAQNPQTTESSIEGGVGIQEMSTATFQATWNPKDTDNSLATAVWSLPAEKEVKLSDDTYRKLVRSISLDNNKGTNATISLVRYDDDPVLSYNPMEIDYSKDGHTGKQISNNYVQVKAQRTMPDGRKLWNYAYAPVPYFYFNWTYNNSHTTMPHNVDPARHIMIVGGFDQVVYDSAGLHPVYNDLTPFQFYIRDENGNDITKNVLDGAVATPRTATIKWNCSPGLRMISPEATELLDPTKTMPYESLADNKDLYGQLCKYENKYYRCIKKHTKAGKHTVRSGDTTIEYGPGQFVYQYWEEINLSSCAQFMYFKPYDSYESTAAEDLFNSWVSLYVKYDKYEAQALIPINVYTNAYESPEMNAWDGKSLEMSDEDGEKSYLLANKVSAGIKDDNNAFVGITIGENVRYIENQAVSTVGLFGYGYKQKVPKNNPAQIKSVQTIFLDAESGRACFGPSGSTQIILDPNATKWSRLAGWYFSQNFLYKPVSPGSILTDRDIQLGKDITPPTSSSGKTFGIYVPSNKTVQDTTIAMWAGTTSPLTNPNGTSAFANTAEFRLTYGGKLYATGADIAGKITAESGEFTDEVDSIKINHTRKISGHDHHYLLYNKNFMVESSATSSDTEVTVKGTIVAKSGKIGRLSGTENDRNTMFLMRQYYPWHYPANNEPFNDNTSYLDTRSGETTTYILYNRNFSIDTSGNVRLEGKIFAESGRLGGWVIQPNDIRSYTYDAVNEAGARLAYDGDADFGVFHISKTGALRGPTWWITAEGVAHFTNDDNEYNGVSYSLKGGGSFTGEGLHIPNGGALTIGENGGQLRANDQGDGFTFEGCNYMNFNPSPGVQSQINFGADINISPGKKIQLNGAEFYLDYTGLNTTSGTYHFSNNGGVYALSLNVGPNHAYYFNSNGELKVNSIIIGSETLENYIRRIMSESGYVTSVVPQSAELGTLGPNASVVTSVLVGHPT